MAERRAGVLFPLHSTRRIVLRRSYLREPLPTVHFTCVHAYVHVYLETSGKLPAKICFWRAADSATHVSLGTQILCTRANFFFYVRARRMRAGPDPFLIRYIVSPGAGGPLPSGRRGDAAQPSITWAPTEQAPHTQPRSLRACSPAYLLL